MPSVQLSFWISDSKYVDYRKNRDIIRAVLRDELYRLLGQEKRVFDEPKKAKNK